MCGRIAIFTANNKYHALMAIFFLQAHTLPCTTTPTSWYNHTYILA